MRDDRNMKIPSEQRVKKDQKDPHQLSAEELRQMMKKNQDQPRGPGGRNMIR
jgi:hypothetical protein